MVDLWGWCILFSIFIPYIDAPHLRINKYGRVLREVPEEGKID